LELAYHRFLGPAPSDAPTVVCLHGFLDHGLSFARTARELAADHQIIAVDFRGFGHSGWVDRGGYYHIADYFADVLSLLDRLALPRLSILAHSMGGGVATAIAPILGPRLERLVLLEGLGPPSEPLEATVDRVRGFYQAVSRPELDVGPEERRRARPTLPSLAEAADRMRRPNPRLDEAHALELATTASEPAEHGKPGAVVWRFDPLHRTPSPKRYNDEENLVFLRAIEVPVLALYGADTGWAHSDLGPRHAALRRLRVAGVPGAGHNMHHDQPALLARAVRSWLSDPTRLPEGLLADVALPPR
jgi:pimeloyl-ACP methyl ester carboxylesterase